MKANEVLRLLQITRQTLHNYVKFNKIKYRVKTSGDYDYDKESVYKIMDKELERINAIYCRVSTNKQKQDLENQKEALKTFCTNNGIIIHHIYEDIGSGLNFDRKQFQMMLNDIVSHKINNLFITYKDRLSDTMFNGKTP